MPKHSTTPPVETQLIADSTSEAESVGCREGYKSTVMARRAGQQPSVPSGTGHPTLAAVSAMEILLIKGSKFIESNLKSCRVSNLDEGEQLQHERVPPRTHTHRSHTRTHPTPRLQTVCQDMRFTDCWHVADCSCGAGVEGFACACAHTCTCWGGKRE